MNLNLSGEDLIQAEIVQWARKEELTRKEFQLLFHVPNGGARSQQAGMKFKALGVRPGCPDLALPVARGGFHGLWLEVKDGEKGIVSDVQEMWQKRLREEGHCVGVIRSVDEGINALTCYLNLPPPVAAPVEKQVRLLRMILQKVKRSDDIAIAQLQQAGHPIPPDVVQLSNEMSAVLEVTK